MKKVYAKDWTHLKGIYYIQDKDIEHNHWFEINNGERFVYIVGYGTIGKGKTYKSNQNLCSINGFRIYKIEDLDELYRQVLKFKILDPEIQCLNQDELERLYKDYVLNPIEKLS